VTSFPPPSEVNANVDAGVDDPNTPGLNVFGAAWGTLTDFTGTWAQNSQLQIQTYGDVISGYFPD
jgi:hypothetical protein